jgi:hypothetical protein
MAEVRKSGLASVGRPSKAGTLVRYDASLDMTVTSSPVLWASFVLLMELIWRASTVAKPF